MTPFVALARFWFVCRCCVTLTPIPTSYFCSKATHLGCLPSSDQSPGWCFTNDEMTAWMTCSNTCATGSLPLIFGDSRMVRISLTLMGIILFLGLVGFTNMLREGAHRTRRASLSHIAPQATGGAGGAVVGSPVAHRPSPQTHSPATHKPSPPTKAEVVKAMLKGLCVFLLYVKQSFLLFLLDVVGHVCELTCLWLSSERRKKRIAGCTGSALQMAILKLPLSRPAMRESCVVVFLL